jgi:hypothetical protein
MLLHPVVAVVVRPVVPRTVMQIAAATVLRSTEMRMNKGEYEVTCVQEVLKVLHLIMENVIRNNDGDNGNANGNGEGQNQDNG